MKYKVYLLSGEIYETDEIDESEKRIIIIRETKAIVVPYSNIRKVEINDYDKSPEYILT